MKNNLLIALIGALMMACGGLKPAANANSTFNTNNAVNTDVKPANTNTDNAVNANAANKADTPKPADSGPTRIAFGKGQTSGSENVTLAPGESKKFVIGIGERQLLSIESSAKEATISILTKGKTTDVFEDDGSYSATTTAGGDIVFQITNGTKKPFKSSIRVDINSQGE